MELAIKKLKFREFESKRLRDEHERNLRDLEIFAKLNSLFREIEELDSTIHQLLKDMESYNYVTPLSRTSVIILLIEELLKMKPAFLPDTINLLNKLSAKI